MTRALLALITVGLAAGAIIPAASATGSVSAAISCDQPITIMFSGFSDGSTNTATVAVWEDGQPTASQFTWTASGVPSTDTLATAADNHTWEVTATSSVGDYDSGTVTCPTPAPPTTTTQVTVSSPPTQTDTTTTPAQTTPSVTTTTETTTTAAAATPPTVDFTAQAQGNVGEVSFTGTVTAGTNPLEQEVWNFGDGGTALGTTATHTYAQPGEYVVTLTAVDQGGLTGIAAYEVTVTETGSIMGARIPAFDVAKTRATLAKKRAAAEKLAKEKAEARAKAKAKAKRAKKHVSR